MDYREKPYAEHTFPAHLHHCALLTRAHPARVFRVLEGERATWSGEAGRFSFMPAGMQSLWSVEGSNPHMTHIYFTVEGLRRVTGDLIGEDRAVVPAPRFLVDDPVLCAMSEMVGTLSSNHADPFVQEAISEAVLRHVAITQCGLPPRRQRTCTSETNAEKKINRAEEFIRANIGKRLTLRSIALSSGISIPHLTRCFRKKHDKSISDFVRTLRVDLAAQQLRQGGMSLAEVSAEYGFSDQAHMTRLFRNRFGTTPGAWRRRA